MTGVQTCALPICVLEAEPFFIKLRLPGVAAGLLLADDSRQSVEGLLGSLDGQLLHTSLNGSTSLAELLRLSQGSLVQLICCKALPISLNLLRQESALELCSGAEAEPAAIVLIGSLVAPILEVL